MYVILVKWIVEDCFGSVIIGILIGLVVLFLEVCSDGVVVKWFFYVINIG